MSTASPIRARRLRITRTDDCGVPVAEATANSRITRSAFITVGLGADVFRSSDIQVAGADGSICVRSKGVPSLLGYDITIQLCNYDTAILEMLLGASILTDYTTPVEDVGGVISGAGDFNANTVMVEWWPENGSNDACATGGTNPQRPFMHFAGPPCEPVGRVGQPGLRRRGLAADPHWLCRRFARRSLHLVRQTSGR